MRGICGAICATAVLVVVTPACAAPLPTASPLDVSVPAPPQAVTADGQGHLIYELRVINIGSKSRRIESIDVFDPGARARLTTIAAAQLNGAMVRLGAPDVADKTLLPGGAAAEIFMRLDLPPGSPVPKALTHRLRAQVQTEPATAETLDVEPIALRAETARVLAPPLHGALWLAMNGLSNDTSHRRTLIAIGGRARIAQRFATDWTRLAEDGQPFHGDPSNNRNWMAYDADVLAVADGTVVDTNDGIPENTPGTDTMAVPITLATVAGNYIILDIGGGAYAFYAHLKPGSLKVKRGDRVRTGATIAQLGNSGNSDAPHLHFHLVDAPSPLAAEGQAYEIDAFIFRGRVPSLDVLNSGKGWRPGTADRPLPRQNELPSQNAVVDFR